LDRALFLFFQQQTYSQEKEGGYEIKEKRATTPTVHRENPYNVLFKTELDSGSFRDRSLLESATEGLAVYNPKFTSLNLPFSESFMYYLNEEMESNRFDFPFLSEKERNETLSENAYSAIGKTLSDKILAVKQTLKQIKSIKENTSVKIRTEDGLNISSRLTLSKIEDPDTYSIRTEVGVSKIIDKIVLKMGREKFTGYLEKNLSTDKHHKLRLQYDWKNNVEPTTLNARYELVL